ncbi:UPF0122 protein SAMEA3545305_02059, partial [Dysosmobacter welbionis]
GLDVGDLLLVQGVRPLGEVVLQRGEAVLAHEEVHELVSIGRGRVQLEGVLALGDAPGIIPVQVPVAALHRLLHLVLGTAHAGFDMLLQAGAVADDDGGAGIGLRLPQGLQGLGLVITHGHLG